MRARLPRAYEELFKPHRYKAFYGGRGSAKSHSFAEALVIRGVQRRTRWLCCREIQHSLRDSVKKLLEDKIASLNLGGAYQSLGTEIRGPHDTIFLFAGLRSNPDKVKSAEGFDGAWVEEASRASKRSLELLTPTIRMPGSEIWFSWNPDQDRDPVDEMFRGKNGPPPDSYVRSVSWQDNPWFPDVLRAEMLWDRQRDPEKYAHVWMGDYRHSSEARVFKNWRIEDFDEPPPETRFYFGADWGFSIDPTVLVRCWRQGRTIYIDHEVYQVGCQIERTPDLFDQLNNGQARVWPIRADSARPETIDYLRRHGYPKITAALKGAGSVNEGIAFLQSCDLVIHPRCRHVIDELSFYRWKVDEHTGEVLPILEDKKNHTIDALRYALEASRRSAIVSVGPSGVARTSPNDPTR